MGIHFVLKRAAVGWIAVLGIVWCLATGGCAAWWGTGSPLPPDDRADRMFGLVLAEKARLHAGNLAPIDLAAGPDSVVRVEALVRPGNVPAVFHRLGLTGLFVAWAPVDSFPAGLDRLEVNLVGYVIKGGGRYALAGPGEASRAIPARAAPGRADYLGVLQVDYCLKTGAREPELPGNGRKTPADCPETGFAFRPDPSGGAARGILVDAPWLKVRLLPPERGGWDL